MIIKDFEAMDAKYILSWISSEREFKMWSADRYGDYPIEPKEMADYYDDCKAQQAFYPLTFFEDDMMIGHMILRYPKEDKPNLMRLGFVIVNKSMRGKGYGKQIINATIRYATTNFDVDTFDLGVFTCNVGAYKLYQSMGFKVTNMLEKAFNFHGEEWDMAEMTLF